MLLDLCGHCQERAIDLESIHFRWAESVGASEVFAQVIGR